MKTTLVLLFIFVIPFSRVTAHGLYGMEVAGSIAVAFVYDDGTPAADLAVYVYAPERETAWMKGVSDEHGRFAFVPDRVGTWRLVADDALGHRVPMSVEVQEDGLAYVVPVTHRVNHLVSGLGWLLGIIGIWALWLRGRTAGIKA